MKIPMPQVTPALLDAVTIMVGIVCVSIAAGAVDWRAGLATFGGLLLGAELVDSVLGARRRSGR